MRIKNWERAWLALCGCVVLAILAHSAVGYVREVGHAATFREKIADAIEDPACAAVVSAPVSELPAPAGLDRGDPCRLVVLERRWREQAGRSTGVTASDLRSEPVATPGRFGEHMRSASIEFVALACAGLGSLYGVGLALEGIAGAKRSRLDA